MHVLPQLRKLERIFPDQMVAIGVHSPKFPAEQAIEGLRAAILRLGVNHPVVSDPQMNLWSQYTVNAWPTLMFVDPAGRVIGKHEGEFRLEEFETLLSAMLGEFDARGLLDRRALDFLRPETPPTTPLLFPSKLLADAASDTLYIADSGHDRIVVADLNGHVQQVIGGVKGFKDGSPREAAFDFPQGLAIAGDGLYVADTWNNALRRIDLPTGSVATVAGTGEQAIRVREGPGPTTPLNSPWDLAVHGDTIFMAMAGSHHIVTYDVRSGEVLRYAGSGREALTDGPLVRATFAQPSGITTGGRYLYVADSESSSIREVDLPEAGNQARTLVGQGLFVFGNVDGVGDRVRLQHPLGVSYDSSSGLLYVADSYNNEIKQLDPRTRAVVTLLGDGVAALKDGVGRAASFFEPGGLGWIPGRLYVADTNNHAVRVVDLGSLLVETLELSGL